MFARNPLRNNIIPPQSMRDSAKLFCWHCFNHGVTYMVQCLVLSCSMWIWECLTEEVTSLPMAAQCWANVLRCWHFIRPILLLYPCSVGITMIIVSLRIKLCTLFEDALTCSVGTCTYIRTRIYKWRMFRLCPNLSQGATSSSPADTRRWTKVVLTLACRRQILMTKDCPRTERIPKNIITVDPWQ